VGASRKNLRKKYGHTYLGTIRKNKKELPYEMLDKKNFVSGQSAFGFSKNMTRVPYASNTSKTQKSWFILSSQCTLSQ